MAPVLRGRAAPRRPASVREVRAASVWRWGAARAQLRAWRALLEATSSAFPSRRRVGLRPPALPILLPLVPAGLRRIIQRVILETVLLLVTVEQSANERAGVVNCAEPRLPVKERAGTLVL